MDTPFAVSQLTSQQTGSPEDMMRRQVAERWNDHKQEMVVEFPRRDKYQSERYDELDGVPER